MHLKQQAGRVKHEGPNCYQPKDMANVKVFADKQMDELMHRQTDRPKTICPSALKVFLANVI